jgi:hypothetical protein
MACNLTSGRLLDCKDGVGGIRSILLAQNASYKTAGPIYSANGELTGFTTAAQAYRYDLPKHTANFSESIVVSVENGTVFYEDTLVIKLHKLDAAMRNELKLIAQNRLTIFVLDNNNNQWAFGELLGAELTAGTASTGTTLGDSNSYDLTFVSQEREPMRFAGTFTATPFDNITNLTETPAY